ncbi:hypothetical protein LCGC14_0979560 [marine sediment metagenome]|uniref:Uncharacterized protein n=1 Tax=marine sediment metagenome TaxID=412755 RepID=A0A0F9NVD9_9ZZZZ
MIVVPPKSWTRKHNGCGIEAGLPSALAYYSRCLGCLAWSETFEKLNKGQQDMIRAGDNAVVARLRGLE